MYDKWSPELQARQLKDQHDNLLIQTNSGASNESLSRTVKKIEWHINEFLNRHGHNISEPYVRTAENIKRRLLRLKEALNLPE